MKALIVILMALVPSLIEPVPSLADRAEAQMRQVLPVDVTVPSPEGTVYLTGDSWLQIRLTPEAGGTRVEGLADWHEVVLTVGGTTYRATNDLHFSSWTDADPPFAFDLATGLTEQDGIYYYFEHADGDHGPVVPEPPPLLIAFTIHGVVDRDGGIQANYGDVRVGCDRCRP